MESSNLHSSSHHHGEDHVVESCVIPSSLSFSSMSVANHNEHAWRPSPTFFLNNIHATCNEASPIANSLNNPMIQNLTYSIPNNNDNINIIQPNSHHHEHHQHLISNKIKEESSTSSDQSNSSSFQSFSEMLSPSSTISPTYKNHMFHPLPFQPIMQLQNSNNNSINNNISNNNININDDFPRLGGLNRGITTFSQIFPSVNISKLSLSSANINSSDFQGGLDLFSREGLLGGGSENQASNSNFLELFKGGSHYGVNHDLQESNDLKLCNKSNHHSSFNNNGVLEPKRPSYIVEPDKSTHSFPSNKKQRFETRAPCPPFKVRKEKLGDRIAALQQLVAPFGKTDTASVLIEAIGYIKFLHNQIETLSAPYMKLGPRDKISNNYPRISEERCEKEANEKQDLRSRGLCLVPLTCMSYIASDFEINEGVWPPHHFSPTF
ncbi:hypothetical protein vseg_009189 [Gypsophila vaccaria]